MSQSESRFRNESIPRKNESPKHLALKTKARELLLQKGFDLTQIFEEYETPIDSFGIRCRVDVAGISPTLRVAVECGMVDKVRLAVLQRTFTEVWHLRFSGRVNRFVNLKQLPNPTDDSITCPLCGWTITRSGWKGSMQRQLEVHQKGKDCSELAKRVEVMRGAVEA